MHARWLILTVLCLSVATSPLRAQPAEPDSARIAAFVERQMEEMGDVLSLSDDQATAIRAVLAEHARQMQALREGPRPAGRRERRARMEQMRAEREALDRAILDLLDEDQQARYQVWVQERREALRDRGGNRRGGF
ncbi:hypothetical protein AWN76_001125 [Rhodothermaceae bacterium RA]|nr:hypothetical protein AWN76_001125 [Rhodothermaceae bacterium RA]